MPKVIRVEDGDNLPLRVTYRKARRLSGRRHALPSIRVKCGDCEEAIVITYENGGLPLTDHEPSSAILEIEGVSGTVEQWRKVLLPLLGFLGESQAPFRPVLSRPCRPVVLRNERRFFLLSFSPILS